MVSVPSSQPLVELLKLFWQPERVKNKFGRAQGFPGHNALTVLFVFLLKLGLIPWKRYITVQKGALVVRGKVKTAVH